MFVGPCVQIIPYHLCLLCLIGLRSVHAVSACKHIIVHAATAPPLIGLPPAAGTGKSGQEAE